MDGLEWTGERLMTNVKSELKIEHLHRYGIASQFTNGKIVLDIACGEGYGVNLLSQNSKFIYGVDINDNVIRHAIEKYKQPNIKFITGSATEIPLPDSSVDVVTSFETLEHLKDHPLMMSEIKRVLRSNGTLVISTPDKKNYLEELGVKNEFHLKELYLNEFKELIAKYFASHFLLYQKVLLASFIIPEKKTSGFVEFFGDFDLINQEFDSIRKPIYNICVASDDDAIHSTIISTSIFNDNKLLYSLLIQAEERYKNTYSYRLGHIVLSPFKFIYRLINNRI